MRVRIFSQRLALSSRSGTGTAVWCAGNLGGVVPRHLDNPKCGKRLIGLYEEFKPSPHAFLCWLSMNSDQAERVSQKTFSRLLGFRFQADTEDSLRARLLRVPHDSMFPAEEPAETSLHCVVLSSVSAPHRRNSSNIRQERTFHVPKARQNT